MTHQRISLKLGNNKVESTKLEAIYNVLKAILAKHHKKKLNAERFDVKQIEFNERIQKA